MISGADGVSVTRADVDDAVARTTGQVRRTPVLAAEPWPTVDHPPQHGDADDRRRRTEDADGPLWLKLEMTQHTGSFKARGAVNRLRSAAESGELTDAGVVAASGGNAGAAVAWAAARLGVPAEIYVPTTSAAAKVRRLHALGATVTQVGREYAEAYQAATGRAAQTGAVLCHAYDQPAMVAGAGTLGVELWAQTGGVDTVLVAVGGGGLVAGVAAALDGLARVVGVEPVGAPTLHAALAAGRPTDVPVSGLAADSLGARRVGRIAFDVAVRCDVGSLLVGDDDLVAARQWLWDRYRLVVEHGAAAAMAALTAGAYRPTPGERVAVVLCGANTDPSDLP
ncbi:serine/threonine dehydratase [Micromonospora sp. WMMD882]|uniref:serine/threonine dehydratase n=1 Tax=Micromonospora sp. WMMD882 TaxID=3015151 RepID=UPI00248CE522|nr:serine/threonine dehydratase [Micromonospora sp. WMMD882]WBB79656.1 serine/threonine dehydratase [Micromonospora sp. WMMD882]